MDVYFKREVADVLEAVAYAAKNRSPDFDDALIAVGKAFGLRPIVIQDWKEKEPQLAWVEDGKSD